METSLPNLALSTLAGALAVTWCTGCPQMAIVQGARMVESAAADDRTLEEQAADLELKTDVEKTLLGEDTTLAEKVNVDVYLGRVMLTGVVPTREGRRTAVALARRVAPDHEIFDDIEVASGGDVADTASDFATNKELGVNLLADEGLAAQSLHHRVVNGTAFIIGEAKEESQIARAREVALQTPGVRRVVTHIVLAP